MEYAGSQGVDVKKKKLINVICQAMLWRIWQARNDMAFNSKSTSPVKIMEDIKVMTYLWTLNRSKFSVKYWNIWGKETIELQVINMCIWHKSTKKRAPSWGRTNLETTKSKNWIMASLA